MPARVEDLMVPLTEYAMVGEDATILEALRALRAAQANLPPDRQPHRAVLVRDGAGRIVGKLHHFAFLRALLPDRRATVAPAVLDRAGVGDDLSDASWRALDVLAVDFVDVCERARNVVVKDVCTPASASVEATAPLSGAIVAFLTHQTLSLLVTRDGRTVGLLRLSDLFDELSRQIMGPGATADREV